MSKYKTKIDARGPNGNVFVVIATATKHLRGLEGEEAADNLRRDCMGQHSYADVLAKVREFFPVKT